jgi:hypothetical protein
VDTGTYYFHGFGKLPERNGNFRLMHSGGLALQLGLFLGCNPIVMVGCDCRVIENIKDIDGKYGGMRSNIFRDNQIMTKVQRGRFETVNGKKTTQHLHAFMKRFEQVYQQYKDKHDIYMLGPWSISNTIPWVEWKEYWSDEHPEKKRQRGR